VGETEGPKVLTTTYANHGLAMDDSRASVGLSHDNGRKVKLSAWKGILLLTIHGLDERLAKIFYLVVLMKDPTKTNHAHHSPGSIPFGQHSSQTGS
jgi:hypothetical protein